VGAYSAPPDSLEGKEREGRARKGEKWKERRNHPLSPITGSTAGFVYRFIIMITLQSAQV